MSSKALEYLQNNFIALLLLFAASSSMPMISLIGERGLMIVWRTPSLTMVATPPVTLLLICFDIQFLIHALRLSSTIRAAILVFIKQ